MGLLFFLSLVLYCFAKDASPCNQSSQCGNHSVCEGFLCRCDMGFFTPDGTATNCRDINVPDPACSVYSSECVFCGISYTGPCSKCTNFITSKGECVSTCSGSFQITIVSNTTLSARVCEDFNGSTTAQLPQWAVIVIAVMSGVMILTALVVLLVFAFTWFNRYSSGQFDVEDTNTSLVQEPIQNFANEEHSGENKDDFDADDSDTFYQKLAYLRNHAEVFLSMLNDMRRRLKELPQDAPTAQQYRNVMRDVTRLLYLLNKKSSAIEIPPDGMQLLTWSDQILQRYLASQGRSTGKREAYGTGRLSSIGDQAETNF